MNAVKLRSQDAILDELKQKETRVSIFTTNGVPLKGKIAGHDKFTVIIVNDKNQQFLVYKHAISTVLPN